MKRYDHPYHSESDMVRWYGKLSEVTPMFNFGLSFVGEWPVDGDDCEYSIWIIEFSCGCSSTMDSHTNFYSQVDICESHPEV